MKVCESCSSIASLMDTRSILLGEVKGCGKCGDRHATSEPSMPPSHPELSSFVEAHGRSRKQKQISTMTSVRSEDSALFSLDELERRDSHAERQLFDEDSSAWSLQNILETVDARQTRRSNQEQVIEQIVAMGSNFDLTLAGPAQKKKRGLGKLGSAVAGVTIAVSVAALAGLWVYLAGSELAPTTDEPSRRANATTTQVETAALLAPSPAEVDQQPAAAAAETSSDSTDVPLLRLDPILIQADTSETSVESFEPLVIRGRLPLVTAAESRRPSTPAPAASPEPANVSAPAAEANEPPATSQPSTTSEPRTEADRLLDEALGEQREATSEPVDLSLPQTLTRAQVASVLVRVSPYVRNCGVETNDTININTEIDGSSGRVTRVIVQGLEPGPSRNCVVRAIQRAQFPRFRDDSLSVSQFPLVIR